MDTIIRNLQSMNKLNNREVEVMNLIIQEKSTSSIATILGLKQNTISTIKKSIFLKLRVNSTIGLYKLIKES